MTTKRPPQIYPITDTTMCALTHGEQTKEFIAGGAEWVQIREKRASPRAFYEAAVEAVEIARLHGVKLIVNDRVDIALMAGADGVHLGQDDMPPDAARRVLGERAIIGYSTHSVEQAIQAVLSYPIDYIAIGPVFETSTKQDPDPVVGLAGVIAVRSAIGDFPVVAIGGIGAEVICRVMRSGADSVALISEVLEDGPFQITDRLRELIRAAEKC